jgi:hypothetical protein
LFSSAVSAQQLDRTVLPIQEAGRHSRFTGKIDRVTVEVK